jgi:DNA-binding NarL/FixJ family response regulator
MPSDHRQSLEHPHAGIGVLLVDDFAETRNDLKALLHEDDSLHVVGEAGNGVEAIRAFDRIAPDVVSMNVNMPIMDGITATRIICGREEGARVVILSVMSEADYMRRALYAGAAHYLLKPPVPQQYLDTLKHVASGPPKRPLSAPISRFLDDCTRIESAAEQAASRRGIRVPPCTYPSLTCAIKLAEVLADAGIITSTVLQSLGVILELHDRIRTMTRGPSPELDEALSAFDLAEAADILDFFQGLALEK